MRLPDDSQGGGGKTDPGSATAPSVLACDECGAPVDVDQRYCVVCGAHRRNVNDPAARYLSQASAKSRRSKSGSTARRSPQFGGSRGLVLALVIALIPAAAAAGVIAGRSSNNNDSDLIQALKHHQSAASAQTTTVQAKAVTPQSTTIAASSDRHHAAQTSAKSKPSQGSKSKSGAGSGSSNGKTTSKSSHTSAPKIVGFKATKSQEQQGSNVTQKVQKSTGKNFVNGQSSLPGVVVVK
jgi:hypothetical protein